MYIAKYETMETCHLITNELFTFAVRHLKKKIAETKK